MNFIIQETGEKKSIHFMDENGCDWADEIVGNCGFEQSKFAYDDEKDAFVVPEDEANYWVDFFETFNSCEEELRSLKDIYDADEVDKILCSEMPTFNIDVYKDAVEQTKTILQKRHNTKTA